MWGTRGFGLAVKYKNYSELREEKGEEEGVLVGGIHERVIIILKSEILQMAGKMVWSFAIKQIILIS